MDTPIDEALILKLEEALSRLEELTAKFPKNQKLARAYDGVDEALFNLKKLRV